MQFKQGKKIKVFANEGNSIIYEAFNDFSKAVWNIAKVKAEFLENYYIFSSLEDEQGIALVNLSKNQEGRKKFPLDYEIIIKTDGFSIRKLKNVIFVLSYTDEGIYYGLHDLLEENCDIVYSRGAQDYDFDYIENQSVCFKKTNYIKVSPFVDRAINMCGIGTEGKDHRDYGSARYYARNKINHIDVYEENWIKFGYRFNYTKRFAVNIDDLMEEHPEYFMTDAFGKPKKSHYESYINYTNKEAAKEVAKRYIKLVEDAPDKCYIWSTMPDDPTFYIKHNGREISSLPYTAENGVTVYPEQKNYKSTIYFDFYNRVVKEVAKVYPNVQIITLAYLYSEVAPEVEIDEHLIVALAPITANDKYSFIAKGNTGNEEARKNIENWAKVCKTLCIYTYWFSFKGAIYSRPIVKAVKENLLWFKKLGIKRLLLENTLECTINERLSEKQLASRRYFDMNEVYIWMVNKLIFEPELEIDALMKKYCKIVYKECADEIYGYFKAIEKGYESQNAYVWYAVGGDVYTHQCIIKAGVADEVLTYLQKAVKKAQTPSVKSRVESIYSIVKGEIDKYSSFVDEKCEIVYCGEGKEKILCKEQALYRNNSNSVWRTAEPLKVLRNYETFAFYDEKAKFECRMLYDEENVYVAFSVYDDTVVKQEVGADGQIVLKRESGNPVLSYSETYIGGNALNQSVYYGVISGFGEDKGVMEFYQNTGTPMKQNPPENLEDRKYVYLSAKKEERYYVHIQVIPIKALGVNVEDFTPYGSFVYYTNRYQRAGWKGVGLWSKNNFSSFHLRKIKKGK